MSGRGTTVAEAMKSEPGVLGNPFGGSGLCMATSMSSPFSPTPLLISSPPSSDHLDLSPLRALTSPPLGRLIRAESRIDGEDRKIQCDRKCRVCGDEATGMYFGALVCVPCKTFFLRYAGENFSFVCKHTQTCEITIASRTQCKYCRYQKCLTVGMYRKERPAHVEITEGQQMCAVCQDVANGVHFGAITCEGCKKFFRRGLKEHSTYVCKNDGKCVINPRTRNSCRFCRYQKCLEAGMSREAIQMGRPSKIRPSSHNEDSRPSKMMKQEFNSVPQYSMPHNLPIKLESSHYSSSQSAEAMSPLSSFDLSMIKIKQEPMSGEYQDTDTDPAQAARNIVLDLFSSGMSPQGILQQMAAPLHDEQLTSKLLSYVSKNDNALSASVPTSPLNSAAMDTHPAALLPPSMGTSVEDNSFINAKQFRDTGSFVSLSTVPSSVYAFQPTLTSSASISVDGQHLVPARVNAGVSTIHRGPNGKNAALMSKIDTWDLPTMRPNNNFNLSPNAVASPQKVGAGGDGDRVTITNVPSPNLTNIPATYGATYPMPSVLQTDISTEILTQQLHQRLQYAQAQQILQQQQQQSQQQQSQQQQQIGTNQQTQAPHPQPTPKPEPRQRSATQPNPNMHPPNTSPESAAAARQRHGSAPCGTGGSNTPNLLSPGTPRSRDEMYRDDSSSTNGGLQGPSSRCPSRGSSASCGSYDSKSPKTREHMRTQQFTENGSLFDVVLGVSNHMKLLAKSPTDGSSTSEGKEHERSGASTQQLLAQDKCKLEFNNCESYWIRSAMPDEDVMITGDHCQIIQQILPAYERFVEHGSKVNKNLKAEFDKWMAHHEGEESAPPSWIGSKVVPVYTLSSVTYCKDIPGFTDFDAADQCTIIKLGQSQSRILVAAISWFNEVRGLFDDFMSWRSPTTDPFMQKLLSFAKGFHMLRLDNVEAALLNALVLIATDYPAMKHPEVIDKHRLVILRAFRAYTTANLGTPNNRIETLFLEVPKLRDLGLMHHRETYKMKGIDEDAKQPPGNKSTQNS